MSAHQAMPHMRANAQRALEFDPSLPDAHAMLAIAAALYDYDWEESAREFGIPMVREPVPSSRERSARARTGRGSRR